jgi:hypothetical protein
MPPTRALHEGLPKRETLASRSSWGVSPVRFRAAPTFQPARCIRRPLNAHHAPQPHAHRSYVPRHHEAGVVHPQPYEPHDPEEPVPVYQPHAHRTYVSRHHDAGVVHPQPNEPHNPEEPVPVDQPHADEPLAIEPLALPTLDRHPEDTVHRLTQGRIPTTQAPTANRCILLPIHVTKVAATTLIDTGASASFISAEFAQRLGTQFHRTHARRVRLADGTTIDIQGHTKPLPCELERFPFCLFMCC